MVIKIVQLVSKVVISFLESTLLDADTDALNHGVLFVFAGMVTRLEAGTKEFTEGLPETGPEFA
jgi:hypothetical protein